MRFEYIRRYLLAKPGVVEDAPLLPEIPVFKLGSVMVGYGWPLSVPPLLTLRLGTDAHMTGPSTEEVAETPRRTKDGEWRTLVLDGIIPDDQLLALVDEAYAWALQCRERRSRQRVPSRSWARVTQTDKTIRR
jgi:predicted DNA-binding protein (MmcQ/YjbR family)